MPQPTPPRNPLLKSRRRSGKGTKRLTGSGVPHLVTQGQQALVVLMIASGATIERIAFEMGVDQGTVQNLYRYELEHGHSLAGEKIARGVIARAIRAGTDDSQPGDVTCALAYLKSRMPGWRPDTFEERQARAAMDAVLPISVGVGGDDTVHFYIPDHGRDHVVADELAAEPDVEVDDAHDAPVDIVIDDEAA